ncbi:hypothetical protein Goarm_009208 [Gossypium armourianum]|uniref:Uncharacterized protein n=1 Tax=Gossypium armourianum TaxID=34283 RepID=A0A7J9JS61_9ROSI|nr:hypothetical protein [Gossypium armourianum]
MVSSTLMFILQEMCAYLSSASAVGGDPQLQ